MAKDKEQLNKEALENYELIQSEIKRLEEIKPFKDWKTHQRFKLFDIDKAESTIALNTINNDKLKRVGAHLIMLKTNFEKACRLLNQEDEEFTHQSYTINEWFFDIEHRIKNNANREDLLFLRENAKPAKKLLEKEFKRELDNSDLSEKLKRFKK